MTRYLMKFSVATLMKIKSRHSDDICPNRTGFNAVVMLTDTAKMALVEAMEKIAC